jgi:RNA recognition motif-containing protein
VLYIEKIFFLEGNIKNLGFCFVSFQNYCDAMTAVNLNGKNLYGEECTVEEANDSNSKKWQEKEQRASLECRNCGHTGHEIRGCLHPIDEIKMGGELFVKKFPYDFEESDIRDIFE